MSPMFLDEKLNIDRVAVVGGGPCCLAAAKYLAAEKKFNRITVFEQRSTVGGVWNHTSVNVVDEDFTVPRTRPSARPDNAVRCPQSGRLQFVSPVYDLLDTNIPHTLMNYCDQPFPPGSSLFPKHAVVKQYLQDYSQGLKPHLRLSTQVIRVSRELAGNRMCWAIRARDLESGNESVESFDAVMIANGHYNDPFIPDIHGLQAFHHQHGGVVSHSKFYRRPDQYRDKKVIIVGNSASGIDLSAQIATVCELPIMISEKATVAKAADPSWARSMPEIVEFLPDQRAVRFADGQVQDNVDAVVFCTGYFYSFPFLDFPEMRLPGDGSCIRRLHEHVLSIDEPTLAFLGIPQRVVPFPVAQAQAAMVSRVWADRLSLPSREEMLAEEQMLVGEGKAIHNLAVPKDINYINRLRERSLSAERTDGLENDGVGKMPPHWDGEKAWCRERFPAIKIAARALGDDRHRVQSLHELGFDYEAWLGQQASQKLP